MIRNFEDIHTIRKEINKVNLSLNKDVNIFASLKRIFADNKRIAVHSAVPKGPISVRDFDNIKQTVDKKAKVQYSAIEQLTNLLAEREEKFELAQHIDHLLSNHFKSEDSAVLKKLTELSKSLVKDTQKLTEESDSLLKAQGEKLTPSDFKSIVSDIEAELNTQFEPSNIETKYYVGVDKSVSDTETKPVNHLYYIAYLTLKNFKSNNAIKDLIITVTRRERGNTSKDYVRTFSNKISPASLMKTNIGVEFNNSTRALQIIMTALKVDKLIDVLEPSQIPIKESTVKITNVNIIDQKIDNTSGTIILYLNPKIETQDQAEKVLQDVFVEVKNLIKSVHPRNKNTLKASIPQVREATFKAKNGKQVKKKQFWFRISFGKPENAESVELPRDKVQQFLKILDISNPTAAKNFNTLLKRFIGVT